MISVEMRGTGGPDVLQLVDLPKPAPAAHQVLVRLHAAALNPVDYKVRTHGGRGPNAVLGCDGAGVVESVGESVTRFVPGEEVYFVNGGYGTEQGTYAQYVAIDERFVARKPRTLTFVEAAAVPLVLITAWEALYERAQVREGDSVLVHAGAGGVGHVAVQLARLAGARVFATVSGPEKAAIAASLGAEATIDYRTDSVLGRVLEFTGGGGVDVVFDTVGGATFSKSIELLNYYGTLVTCVERSWPLADVSDMMDKNLRIAWTWMPAPQVFALVAHREAQTRILEQGGRLIDDGKLRVLVGKTYPLDRVAEAHDALQRGAVTGKIVLTIP